MMHDVWTKIIVDPDGQEFHTAWQYTMSKPPFIQHAIPEHVEMKHQKEEQRRQIEIRDKLNRDKQEVTWKSQTETARNQRTEEQRRQIELRDKLNRERQDVQRKSQTETAET